MPNDALPSVLQTGEMISLIRRLAGASGVWTSVTVGGGWFGGLDYQKIGSVIYLRGSATGGPSGATLCTLPVGARPGTNVIFPTWLFTFSTGAISSLGTGDIYFSGISFPQEA